MVKTGNGTILDAGGVLEAVKEEWGKIWYDHQIGLDMPSIQSVERSFEV